MTDCDTDSLEGPGYPMEVQDEMRDLQTKLERAELKNAELSDQLKTRASIAEQVLLDWKLKLDVSNRIIDEQAREKDRQLSEISSDLVYFEECLLRNREAANSALKKKDRRIKELERKLQRQQKQIDALNYANERLLNSLHGGRENLEESNEKRDSVSGYDSDETLCDSERFGESGEVQYNALNVNEYVTGGEQISEIAHISVEWKESVKRETNHYHEPSENGFSCERSSDSLHDFTGPHVDRHTDSHVTYKSARRRKSPDITNGYRRASTGRTQPDRGPTANGTASMNGSSKFRDHRVRFRPDVNKIQEEPDEGCVHDLVKSGEMPRKYSLPSYRLPILEDDDEDEQFI